MKLNWFELYIFTTAQLRAGLILRHETESTSTGRSEIPAVLSFLDKRTKCRVNLLFRELNDKPDAKARTLACKILDFPS